MSQTSRQTSGERIAFLDALRGFAMMGIMLVNVPSINTMAGKEAFKLGYTTTASDIVVADIVLLFFNGKFYPLFAFLFGISFMIFLRNAQSKGQAPQSLGRRRLGTLFGIGLLHIVLVWWGDILTLYSLLGAVLLLSYDLSSRSLLRLAGFMILGPTALYLLLTMFNHAGLLNLEAEFWTNTLVPHDPNLTETTLLYQSGSFLSIAKRRIVDYLFDYTPFLLKTWSVEVLFGYLNYYTQVLGLFFLGFFVGKSQLVPKALGPWDSREKRMGAGVTFLFLTMSALTVSLKLFSERFGGVVFLINGTFIAFFYLCLFLALYRTKRGKRILDGFIPVGRMSLTAYLLHTGAFSLLLYGYGGGFYGRLGPTQLLPAALFFYGGVWLFCQFWMRRFSYGPVEWVWRWATYGKKPA